MLYDYALYVFACEILCWDCFLLMRLSADYSIFRFVQIYLYYISLIETCDLEVKWLNFGNPVFAIAHDAAF